jgi:hypothetical protein
MADDVKYKLRHEVDACIQFLQSVKHAQNVEAVEIIQIALIDR